MISKMKRPEEGGSRVAIVFNGSPLFTGAAGSGESEIRRWIIENDWLEAVVALPDQLFYNTGISTYFWIVTNRKAPERRGKVQLVDAREYFVKMRKSLGEKRKEISDAQIEEITRLYGDFAEGEKVKIFPNEAFGFLRITVERPLRLRWEVTDETIAVAFAAKAIQKLPADTQTALRELLEDERGARFATQTGAGQDIQSRGRRSRARSARTEGAVVGAGRPRRGGSGHHRPQGQPRARPRAARQRERPAASRAGCRSSRIRPSASRRWSTGPRSMTTCGTRCCRMSRTRGSITTRPRSATRSR